MTLKEYLTDYASPATREKGLRLIEHELQHVASPKIRDIARRNLCEIDAGRRDFRF
jgi:2-iminoacetate synthase